MPPFDVQNVIVGGGGGATLRSYAIDLTGNGGTLANGSVSLGGYDWTAYGIGTTSETGITISLSSLWSDYDGSIHPVEVSAETPVWTMGQNYGKAGIARKNETSGSLNFVGGTIHGAHVSSWYQRVGAWIDTSWTSMAEVAAYQTFDCKRIAGTFMGRFTQGTWSGVTTAEPFRIAADANVYSLVAQSVATSNAVPYTQPFGANDTLCIYGGTYAGTSATSIVQDANGITITAGSQIHTWRKLYVWLGSPETA